MALSIIRLLTIGFHVNDFIFLPAYKYLLALFISHSVYFKACVYLFPTFEQQICSILKQLCIC